eukprot:4316306-Amphidinium_carterae.1
MHTPRLHCIKDNGKGLGTPLGSQLLHPATRCGGQSRRRHAVDAYGNSERQSTSLRRFDNQGLKCSA